MYRVKGADQKEYGPISAEQVQQWIRENRLNRFSLAEKDGEPGWKPLDQFPEFAPVLGPVTSQPPSGGISTTAVSQQTEPQQVARMLTPPAILLIFFAIAGIGFAISGLFLRDFFMDALLRAIEQMNLPLDPNVRSKIETAKAAGVGVSDVLQVILGIATNIVMLVGALKMMKLQSWGFALAAAILVMLPCGGCGCFCCLGIPLGIWVIVLLNKPEVKAAFR